MLPAKKAPVAPLAGASDIPGVTEDRWPNDMHRGFIRPDLLEIEGAVAIEEQSGPAKAGSVVAGEVEPWRGTASQTKAEGVRHIHVAAPGRRSRNLINIGSSTMGEKLNLRFYFNQTQAWRDQTRPTHRSSINNRDLTWPNNLPVQQNKMLGIC